MMNPYSGYSFLRALTGVRTALRGLGPFSRWLVRQAMWRQLARGMRRWGP